MTMISVGLDDLRERPTAAAASADHRLIRVVKSDIECKISRERRCRMSYLPRRQFVYLH
jgi:hypothetical protein